MPTFNQLVRKGRQTSVKKSTAPALQKSFNSLRKKESAICYFCIKNNMENAKKALTFGAKRNKLNKRVEKGNVFLMRK